MIEKYNNDIELEDLLGQREDLIKQIQEIRKIYNIDPDIFSGEIWFSIIKPENLDNLNSDSMLGIFDLQSKFRESHNEQVKKLEELNEKINILNIDLVLEKLKIALEEN